MRTMLFSNPYKIIAQHLRVEVDLENFTLLGLGGHGPVDRRYRPHFATDVQQRIAIFDGLVGMGFPDSPTIIGLPLKWEL